MGNIVTFDSKSFLLEKEYLDDTFSGIQSTLSNIKGDMGSILFYNDMTSAALEVFELQYNKIIKSFESIENQMRNISTYLTSVEKNTTSIEDSINQSFSSLDK